MRRSKFEIYFDILSVLVHYGPLKLTHIMYKANVNCNTLLKCINYLVKQGLVEERFVEEGKRVYAVTRRGLDVVRAFKEVKQALPIAEKEVVRRPLFFTDVL
ncbi:MAG: winged helix-turn-helix domain-containing protein [Candidatus Bathyarchaeia archaeon]